MPVNKHLNKKQKQNKNKLNFGCKHAVVKRLMLRYFTVKNVIFNVYSGYLLRVLNQRFLFVFVNSIKKKKKLNIVQSSNPLQVSIAKLLLSQLINRKHIRKGTARR